MGKTQGLYIWWLSDPRSCQVGATDPETCGTIFYCINAGLLRASNMLGEIYYIAITRDNWLRLKFHHHQLAKMAS